MIRKATTAIEQKDHPLSVHVIITFSVSHRDDNDLSCMNWLVDLLLRRKLKQTE